MFYLTVNKGVGRPTPKKNLPFLLYQRNKQLTTNLNKKFNTIVYKIYFTYVWSLKFVLTYRIFDAVVFTFFA